MLDQDPELPEDRRIRYRIGINLGEVIVDGGTIYGDGVNVAARIESLCEPGGVWLSRSVYNQVKGKVDLGLVPSGLHQVKNISEAVETFRVALDGVVPASPRPAGRGREMRWLPYVAAALAALVFLGGVWRFWPGEPPPKERPAIAVLPFDNYGGDEATGRLADGLTEDVITDLAHFRDLDVIARNSVETYKGKPVDVREVGKRLDVGYVLEGSIQRQAERLRITAQLIDTKSDVHLWSERWDRAAQDVFAVQTEIADAVAARLGGAGLTMAAIARSEVAKAKRRPPASLLAYEHYLLAAEGKAQSTEESVRAGLEHTNQAIALDPTFARAYAIRGWLHDFSA